MFTFDESIFIWLNSILFTFIVRLFLPLGDYLFAFFSVRIKKREESSNCDRLKVSGNTLSRSICHPIRSLGHADRNHSSSQWHCGKSRHCTAPLFVLQTHLQQTLQSQTKTQCRHTVLFLSAGNKLFKRDLTLQSDTQAASPTV